MGILFVINISGFIQIEKSKKESTSIRILSIKKILISFACWKQKFNFHNKKSYTKFLLLVSVIRESEY